MHDWHPADIKAALEKAGRPLCQLMRATGYHHSAGGKALRRPWPAVELIIAAALDRPPKDIWPSRYDPDGRPLQGRHSKTNMRRGFAARQKSRRAVSQFGGVGR